MDLSDRLDRMNIHSLSKKGFFLSMLIPLLLFIAFLIGSIFIPKHTIALPENLGNTTTPITTTWSAYINASKINERISLKSRLMNFSKESTTIYLLFNYTINMYNKDKGYVPYINSIDSKRIECKQEKLFCEEFILAHIPYIRSPSYEFIVNVVNATNINTGVQYQFVLVNGRYNVYQLATRLVFLISTFIIIFFVVSSLRYFSWRDWHSEQKWAVILLYGSLFSINLFYALVLFGVYPYPFIILGQILESGFYSMMLLFWLITFDHLVIKEEDRFLYNQLPKYVFIGLYFIFSSIYFSWSSILYFENPAAIVERNKPLFLFHISVMFLISIYIIWMIYIVIRSVLSRGSLPYMSTRYKIFIGISAVIMIVFVTGIILGSYGRLSRYSSLWTSLMTLTYLYVYLYAFYCLPSRMTLIGVENSGMIKLEDMEEFEEGKDFEISEEEEEI